jgi:hypothetical protein
MQRTQKESSRVSSLLLQAVVFSQLTSNTSTTSTTRNYLATASEVSSYDDSDSSDDQIGERWLYREGADFWSAYQQLVLILVGERPGC